MNGLNDSGVSLAQISLIDCRVGGLKSSKSRQYGVGITAFSRKEDESKMSMDIEVEFNLLHQVSNPTLEFICTFSAEYKRSVNCQMQLSDLKDHIAVAHILPFLREFAFNVTGRLRESPALMIPPINANLLLSDWKNRQEQTAAGFSDRKPE
jgi:hypothetical protein